MENSDDLCSMEGDGDGRGNINNASRAPSTSTAPASSSPYKLFRRQSSFHQMMGGGKEIISDDEETCSHYPRVCPGKPRLVTLMDKGAQGAADVILWRWRRGSFGIIVIATVAWLLFEHSGLPFLSVCSDILLVLTVLLFLRANYAAYKNKQLQTLPQLVLSEEMVNNAAASFRVKINYMLLMAHDITLGKDFKLVVIVLWLLSTIGSMRSVKGQVQQLVPIGIVKWRPEGLSPASYLEGLLGLKGQRAIMFITVPALYSRFEAHVDRCAGKLHQQFTRHYRIVDESISRLPRNVAKDKDH
nr:reticulon-like protein B16 [Ipomoea batatas]